jgi:hypothetical protein
MKIWKDHSRAEILKSMMEETAKTKNELRCAQKDLEKANNRLSFCLSALNHLTQGDIQNETK